MGDKSMDEGVQATPSELEHIKRLVKESVEEGAVGFPPLDSSVITCLMAG
jgi:N-acyl-D-aspartate/D-glutamate deacylase